MHVSPICERDINETCIYLCHNPLSMTNFPKKPKKHLDFEILELERLDFEILTTSGFNGGHLEI